MVTLFSVLYASDKGRGKGNVCAGRNLMENNIINEKARFTYRREVERTVERKR